jgi:uncharacterized protein (DUF58 family)
MLMLVGQDTARPRTVEDLLGPALSARLDRLDVLSRKVFAGKLPGERRSKRRGRSVEFDDYRNYVPGDDLRHVDWNVFARMDRFFIKIFREEEDLALHVVLDASASMDAGDPNKLVFAQRLAMALSYIGLVNQNRLALSIIGAPGRPGVQRLTAMRGRRNMQRAARFIIENVRAGDEPAHELPHSAPRQGGGAAAVGEGAFNEALRALALSRTGSGVMVILSDFLVRDDLSVGLNYLAAGPGGGFDTYCLQLLAPGELEPRIERERGLVGDLRLTDAESGRGAEVTVTAALIRRYKQRLEEHCRRLQQLCAARRMVHALVRSDAQLEPLLMDYLRRRGLLG